MNSSMSERVEYLSLQFKTSTYIESYISGIRALYRFIKKNKSSTESDINVKI